MGHFEHLEYDVQDAAAVIRLDRQEKRNALNLPLIEELTEALDRGESEKRVRAIILTGNGPAFSAGYDLGESRGNSGYSSPTVEDWLDRFEKSHAHIRRIHDLNIPVIAAVNGYALAGGSDLALVCDLTIASERAELGYPGIRLSAFPPTLVYPFVMGSIKHAREMLYSGKRIGAEEAARMGMVNRTVPHDSLLDEAWAEVEEIRKVPPLAVRLAKHTLNDVMADHGFDPTHKHAEFVDALAHQTDSGKRFVEIRDEEGVDAAIRWMNEVDK